MGVLSASENRFLKLSKWTLEVASSIRYSEPFKLIKTNTKYFRQFS
jgi:hypothetical protein